MGPVNNTTSWYKVHTFNHQDGYKIKTLFEEYYKNCWFWRERLYRNYKKKQLAIAYVSIQHNLYAIC